MSKEAKKQNIEDNPIEGWLDWNPEEQLESISEKEIYLGRGFLLSDPSNLVPGFKAYWLPFLTSLGISFEVKSIEPIIDPPKGLSGGGLATIDEQLIGVVYNKNTINDLIISVFNTQNLKGQNIVERYILMRLFASLAQCWSGTKISSIKFDPTLDINNFRSYATVKLLLEINANRIEIYFLLGKLMANEIDQLCRKQIQSNLGTDAKASKISINIANLAVPTDNLGDYLTSGTVIDLETPVSSEVTLSKNNLLWRKGILLRRKNSYVVKIKKDITTDNQIDIPKGTTLLTISLGVVNLDPISIAEIRREGAVWDTKIPLDAKAIMSIDGQNVSVGSLGIYQGNFALKVGG